MWIWGCHKWKWLGVGCVFIEMNLLDSFVGMCSLEGVNVLSVLVFIWAEDSLLSWLMGFPQLPTPRFFCLHFRASFGGLVSQFILALCYLFELYVFWFLFLCDSGILGHILYIVCFAVGQAISLFLGTNNFALQIIRWVKDFPVLPHRGFF